MMGGNHGICVMYILMCNVFSIAPPEWLPFHGYEYAVLRTELSYNDAMTECVSQDAHVTGVLSLQQTDFLDNIIRGS